MWILSSHIWDFIIDKILLKHGSETKKQDQKNIVNKTCIEYSWGKCWKNKNYFMFKLQRVCSHIDTSWLCVPACSWCLLTLKRCLQGCVLLIPVYCAEQIIFHPQHSAPGLLPFCLHSFSYSSVQFSHSVVSDSDPMDCSTPGPPVQHQLPESTQTHVHWVSDAP